MVAELVHKYLWLIRLLTGKGERGLSLGEIASRYEENYGEEYPRRTFNNHRGAILDVFGIEILCNRSTNRYYIPYAEDAVDADNTTKWMIDTFTVDALLRTGKKSLKGRISVEDIPSGHKHLTVLMQAMLDSRKVGIEYRKYTRAEGEPLTVHPYALKEFARRWYLVAWCEQRGGLRVYGLDRIHALTVLEDGFTLPDGFDVEDLFSESYGIYLPDNGDAVTIRFRARESERPFLNDLPIHPSQRLAEETPEGPVYRLRLIPNENFIMELCRLGDRIEVLEPASLRARIAEEHRKALNLYK